LTIIVIFFGVLKGGAVLALLCAIPKSAKAASQAFGTFLPADHKPADPGKMTNLTAAAADFTCIIHDCIVPYSPKKPSASLFSLAQDRRRHCFLVSLVLPLYSGRLSRAPDTTAFVEIGSLCRQPREWGLMPMRIHENPIPPETPHIMLLQWIGGLEW